MAARYVLMDRTTEPVVSRWQSSVMTQQPLRPPIAQIFARAKLAFGVFRSNPEVETVTEVNVVRTMDCCCRTPPCPATGDPLDRRSHAVELELCLRILR